MYIHDSVYIASQKNIQKQTSSSVLEAGESEMTGGGGVCYIGKKVRTAAIEEVHPKDVSGAHSGGSANGYIGVGDGNDGWLPVPREGKPMVQIHSSENSFKLYTYHHALFFKRSRTTCSFPNEH